MNFERHRPEAVELPRRPVRRGDKVHILPPRGSTDRGDRRLWPVTRIEKVDGERRAHLSMVGALSDERQDVYRQLREMSAQPPDLDLAKPAEWLVPHP